LSSQYKPLKVTDLKKVIQKDRLAAYFLDLIKINSVSKNEKLICQAIQEIMNDLGAEIIMDNAGKKIDGNSGNLIVRFPGNISSLPLMFCAHMDTVQPGENVQPVVKNGVFTSNGKTILGADDKSGIAIIVECMRVIKENKISHGPIELIFTVGEEIGLLGAKHLQYEYIESTYGYVLDIKDPNIIITHAPSAIHFLVTITGKDAHAGMEPEKGINSIHLASKAIASLPVGRIDHETTLNVGEIRGGVATNIVPRTVTIKGEARSHSEEKLNTITRQLIDTFESVVHSYPKYEDSETGLILPDVQITIEEDFKSTHIDNDHPVVKTACEAARRLERNFQISSSGGASDANVFFQNGLMTGVLGTGMTDVHTVKESICLDDMVKAVELMLMIIQVHLEQHL